MSGTHLRAYSPTVHSARHMRRLMCKCWDHKEFIGPWGARLGSRKRLGSQEHKCMHGVRTSGIRDTLHQACVTSGTHHIRYTSHQAAWHIRRAWI